MIISLNSYIGGGKDTTAKIIQELYPQDNWQIKKFAHSLKQITSILTGISVEDLDKQDIKQRKLENLTVWKLDWLDSYGHGAQLFSDETDALKEQKKMFDTGSYYSLTIEEIIPTVRSILQLLGTDLLRNRFHPDIWVNVLMKDYKKLYLNDPWYDDKDIFNVSELDETLHPPILPNWVISDLRFKNEYQAIKNRNGVTIHIKRYKPTNFHDSEIQLNDCEFDYTIDNTKDISYLTDQIKEVYNDIRRNYSWE